MEKVRCHRQRENKATAKCALFDVDKQQLRALLATTRTTSHGQKKDQKAQLLTDVRVRSPTVASVAVARLIDRLSLGALARVWQDERRSTALTNAGCARARLFIFAALISKRACERVCERASGRRFSSPSLSSSCARAWRRFCRNSRQAKLPFLIR